MNIKSARTASLLIAVALVLQACSTTISRDADDRVQVHGVWETYDTIGDLARRADLVVVGTVGAFVDRYEIWDQDPLTGEEILAKADDVYRFNITQVVAGTLPEPTKTLLVGAVDFGAEVENTTGFTPGEDLVLFLAPFTFGGTEPGWVPLSADSGIFDISEGRLVARGVVGNLAGYQRDLNEALDAVANVGASTSGE